MPYDERLAACLQQRFRQAVGQWTHALAASRSENHCMHGRLTRQTVTFDRRRDARCLYLNGGAAGSAIASKRVTGARLGRRLLEAVEQQHDRLERAVALGDCAHVADEARGVLEIRALAVAVIETRENAEHF